jgi:hypothetical protein
MYSGLEIEVYNAVATWKWSRALDVRHRHPHGSFITTNQESNQTMLVMRKCVKITCNRSLTYNLNSNGKGNNHQRDYQNIQGKMEFKPKSHILWENKHFQ